jgi:hypothetical protein
MSKAPNFTLFPAYWNNQEDGTVVCLHGNYFIPTTWLVFFLDLDFPILSPLLSRFLFNLSLLRHVVSPPRSPKQVIEAKYNWQ